MPIASDIVNGEARYRLLGARLPALVPRLRHAALALAREALGSLHGSSIVAELDRLIGDTAGAGVPPFARARTITPAPPEAILAILERAIVESRSARLRYHGARDTEARERDVVPRELRLVKGQLYLAAYDLASGQARTFKIARVRGVQPGTLVDRKLLAIRDTPGSVGVWVGPKTAVAIRLAPDVARFAGEYPLIATQTVTTERDGAAIVRAEVAGEEEVLKWVLSWGRGAEVLSPPSLRARAREELTAALAPYRTDPDRPGPVRARGESERVVSRIAGQATAKVEGEGVRAVAARRGR